MTAAHRRNNRTTRSWRRTGLATISLVLLASACSSDSKVGSDDLLTFEQQEQQALGATTTTAPPAQESATDGEQAAAPPSTQAPATTAPPPTTAAPQQATLEIIIAGDDQKSQFQPPAARVLVGSLIRWTNGDTVPRSIVADDGTFDSGPIPPGGSWDYVASTPGRFNYSDGTRPYAVGLLEVQG